MKYLTVKKIDHYGDETASVILESDTSSVEVFCHLCEYKEGDKIENLLHVLDADVKTASLSDWPNELIEENSKERLEKTGPYSYKGCAKVIDFENCIIEVLGFRIEVEDMPYQGAIEFEISRLDLW